MDLGPPSVAAVHVWVAPLDVASPVLASLVSSLTPAERSRARRYRFTRDAQRFSAARGWLRHVLGAQLGIPPHEVELAEEPGKPRLADAVAPCFNVSHAGNLALLAVAGSEVGVDVEHGGSAWRGLDAAGLALSPPEAAALDRLPPAERAEAFLCRWTAKEAYLKARGLGLSVPPDRVEIGTAPSGPSPVRVTGEPGPARWWVRELRPVPAYVGAVAAEGRDWLVRMRSTAELGLGAPAGRSDR